MNATGEIQEKGKFMKFEVRLTKEAEKDYRKLDKISQNKLNKAFDKVENKGIETVVTKPLGKDLYEIKTDNLRALFAYQGTKVIVVGVIFIKKSQKTPAKYIDRAKKILEI